MELTTKWKRITLSSPIAGVALVNAASRRGPTPFCANMLRTIPPRLGTKWNTFSSRESVFHFVTLARGSNRQIDGPLTTR